MSKKNGNGFTGKVYDTKNCANYINVRLVQDAKFFPKNEKGPAVTVLTFAHNNAAAPDVSLFIDARVHRGAELMSELRKGDVVSSVIGELRLKRDDRGETRGVIFNAQAETMVSLRERAEGGGDGGGEAVAFQ